jgi:hypothetical protein
MPNNAPNASTFDLATPRRPTTNDFNGAAKIDDAQYPPDAQTMPSAFEYNTLCLLVVALGKALPVAVVSVTGGNPPTLAGFAAPGSAVVSGSFTLTRNAVGDVSITWPANTFPTPAVAPSVSTNAGTWCDADVVAITNGVRVRTYNGTGAATDLSFTVTVY